MAESVKIATRESFGKALCELAKTHSDIVVLDADLSAATKTDIFAKEYQNKFIDCGIAECNMIGVAARSCSSRQSPICCIICNVCNRSCIRANQKYSSLSCT